jgi:hypothetical protein
VPRLRPRSVGLRYNQDCRNPTFHHRGTRSHRRREVLFRSARLQALALERALFLHGVRRQLFRGRRSPTTSIRTIPGNGGCLNARPKDATWKPNVDDGKKVLARVTDGLKPSAAARRIFFKPLVMPLCGEVAQRRAGWDRSDEYHRVRCGNDRKQWLSVLDAITETRADGVAMMREMISEAHRIIDAHWELLEELARELLQYRKLDEHEIKQIVGDLSRLSSRWIVPVSRASTGIFSLPLASLSGAELRAGR